MASLTDKLPTEMRGRETQQPVPVAPSFLESLADFGTKAISAVDEGNRNFNAAQARRRQAEQDRIAAEKRGAENAGAIDSAEVFYGPLDQPAVDDAKNLAPELLAQQTAAEQGRMSPEQVKLRTAAKIRARLANFPNSAAAYMRTLKEFGVTDVMTSEYDAAEKANEAEATAAREREDSVWKYGLDKLGIVKEDLNPVDQEKARTLILKDMQNAEILNRNLTRATIDEKNASVTRAQREELEANNSQDTAQAILNSFSGHTFAAEQAIAQILNDTSIPDAKRDEAISRALRALGPEADLMYRNLVTQHSAYMKPADRQLLDDQYNRFKASVTAMLTGPSSIVETNLRQVKNLESALNIQSLQSYPMWMELRNTFGPGAALDGFLTDILSNPKITEGVRREINGMGDTLGVGESRVRINNLMKILKGDMSVHDLTPQEAHAQYPHLLTMMGNTTNDANVQNGKDVASHSVALNSIGGVANAAIEANSSWGARGLTNFITKFASAQVFNTLATNTANNEDRVRTINAFQPALQQSYLALKDAPVDDKFFDAHWNSAKKEWEWKRNKVPSPKQAGNSLARFGPLPMFKEPEASAVLRAKVNAMNQAIRVQTMLGDAGYDPEVPKNGVTHAERREWYGRGVLPASIKQKKATEGVDQSKNIEDVITSTIKSLGSLEFTPGDIPDRIHAAENSTGDPGAKNPNSTATGNGQFIEGTWLDVIKRNRPDLVEGKSREEVLNLRTDPAVSREMTTAYARENASYLTSKGLPAGPAELSLAHFAGARGAEKILRANPSTPIEQLMTPREIAANSFLKGKTAREVIQWASDRI